MSPVPYGARGSWRRAILLERIRELCDAKFKAFSDADRMFYGSPRSVRMLISGAIEAFESDNMKLAERWCDVAERKLLRERRKFQSKSPAERLEYSRQVCEAE